MAYPWRAILGNSSSENKELPSSHRNTHGTQFIDVYQIKDLMNDDQISISGLFQLILE